MIHFIDTGCPSLHNLCNPTKCSVPTVVYVLSENQHGNNNMEIVFPGPVNILCTKLFPGFMYFPDSC